MSLVPGSTMKEREKETPSSCCMVACWIGACGTGSFPFSRNTLKRFALLCAVQERARASFPPSHVFRTRMPIISWTGQRAEELNMAVMQGDLARAVEVFLVMWTDGPFRSPEQVDHAARERICAMATRSMELGTLALPFRELEPPASGRLAEIQVPTLIVLGDRDTSDIQVIGHLLHQQVAGSELVLMPGVGHALVMEKPAAFHVFVAQCLHW
jgi:pimeloyl-ACP methyl ester carboxylesterase